MATEKGRALHAEGSVTQRGAFRAHRDDAYVFRHGRYFTGLIIP